mgnify:CR=1 FL=1
MLVRDTSECSQRSLLVQDSSRNVSNVEISGKLTRHRHRKTGNITDRIITADNLAKGSNGSVAFDLTLTLIALGRLLDEAIQTERD